MNKKENLKLKDVEILDENVLKMSTFPFGSASGSEFGSFEGSGRKFPCNGCPDNECGENSDCGAHKVCVKGGDCGWLNMCSWTKCRNMDHNELECEYKDLGKSCNYLWVDGNYYKGYCSQNSFAKAPYCAPTFHNN